MGIQRLYAGLREINGQFDWQFVAIVAMGATQIALLMTLVVMTG